MRIARPGYIEYLKEGNNMANQNTFLSQYEAHVGLVAAGKMAESVTDMDQSTIPQVFEGVQTPSSAPEDYTILGAYRRDGEWYGDTVYHVGDKVIGLRSIWRLVGGDWKAYKLENFDPPEDS